VEALEQHGLISGMPYALAFLADAQMQRGDLEAAIETLARVDALPELARGQPFVYDARGRLRFLQGRYPRRARRVRRRARAGLRGSSGATNPPSSRGARRWRSPTISSARSTRRSGSRQRRSSSHAAGAPARDRQGPSRGRDGRRR
jgi:hypothetical protein